MAALRQLASALACWETGSSQTNYQKKKTNQPNKKEPNSKGKSKNGTWENKFDFLCVCVWAHTERYIEIFLPDVNNINIDTHFYYCWQNFMLLEDSPPRKANGLVRTVSWKSWLSGTDRLISLKKLPKVFKFWSEQHPWEEEWCPAFPVSWTWIQGKLQREITPQEHTGVSVVNSMFLQCSARC